MRLKDLVIVIKNLVDFEFPKDGPYQYDIADIQDLIISGACWEGKNVAWNDMKRIHPDLQIYETFMHDFFLNDISNEKLDYEKLVKLLHIFMDLFQRAYIDNGGYVPDLSHLSKGIMVRKGDYDDKKVEHHRI